MGKRQVAFEVQGNESICEVMIDEDGDEEDAKDDG